MDLANRPKYGGQTVQPRPNRPKYGGRTIMLCPNRHKYGGRTVLPHPSRPNTEDGPYSIVQIGLIPEEGPYRIEKKQPK